MSDYYHPDADYFRKELGVEPPSAIAHGVSDTYTNPMSSQIPKLKFHSWRMEGNKLIGMSEHGEFCQTISTDYICEGTDSNGLPKLRKISV